MSSDMLYWMGFVSSLIGGAAFGDLFEKPISAVVVGSAFSVAGILLQKKARPAEKTVWNYGRRTAAFRKVLVLALSDVRGASDEQPAPSFVPLTGDLAADLAALAEQKRQAAIAEQKRKDELAEQKRKAASAEQEQQTPLAEPERKDEPPDKKGGPWSWEQTLRAIHYQLADGGPLERVVLVCSPESVAQVHLFLDRVVGKYRSLSNLAFDVFCRRDLSLKRWKKDDVKVSKQNGVDFSNFDELTEAYGAVVRALRREGFASRDIQIDFTGGQKPTSVVAAAVTLNNRLSNQYVATNPKDKNAPVWEYEVIGYDFLQRSES